MNANTITELQESFQSTITALYWFIFASVVGIIVFNVLMYRIGASIKRVQEEFKDIRKDIECRSRNQ